MNPITIVIPTLDAELGAKTGAAALAMAGCHVPVHLVVSHDKVCQGFTKTVNDGIRQVSATHDICLLNDDVSNFPASWLEIMRRVLYSNKRFGLSCPTGASAAAPMSAGTIGMRGTQVVRQVSFWCVLIKRAVIDDIGLLDEAMIHYCSDNWYCDLMHKRGWKCVWAKAVYLKHRQHGSGMKTEWRDHDRRIYFARRKR
ncbi:MAG: hypothetical protein PVJ86_13480 [Phycisphaerales bacterium]